MLTVAPEKLTEHSYHNNFCDFRSQNFSYFIYLNKILGAYDIWQHLLTPIFCDVCQKLLDLL